MTDLAIPPTDLTGWLAALANPGAAGASPEPLDLLRQLSETNPQLAGLAQYLALREQLAQAQAAKPDPEDEDEGDAPSYRQWVDGRHDATPAPDDGQPALRGEIRVMVRAVLIERDELRARNEALASALGACPECWGRDIACRECQGRGAPGAYLPDPRLFGLWVVPAVRAMRRARAADVNSNRGDS